MSKLGKILCLLTSVALWQGCSSTGDNGDASTSDASTDTGSDAPNLFLSQGMNNYKITDVTVTSDLCQIDPASIKNMTLPVNYIPPPTQTLSVGTLVGSPLQPSLGSGVIGVTGTLNRDNMVTDSTGCTWHQINVSTFNLIGVVVFKPDVTETENQFTAACGTSAPTGGSCMSVYKFTFSMPTPIADGGA